MGIYGIVGGEMGIYGIIRFRDPQTRQRLQWRTVSFGISEAPRLCTKLLRPLVAILKQMGIRCI